MHISTMKEFNAILKIIFAVQLLYDHDVFKALCEFAGLDYDCYQDLDPLLDDLAEFAETHEGRKGEV